MQENNNTSVYDLVKLSPDRKHVVDLFYKGEYSMANYWYSLAIDGKQITGREVVDSCVWSEDSKYFAIAEIPAGENPRDGKFAVLVFDVEQGSFASVSHTDGLRPVRFEENKLICLTWRGNTEFIVELATLDWQ